MSETFSFFWRKAADIYAWLASWIEAYPKLALAALIMLAVAALL